MGRERRIRHKISLTPRLHSPVFQTCPDQAHRQPTRPPPRPDAAHNHGPHRGEEQVLAHQPAVRHQAQHEGGAGPSGMGGGRAGWSRERPPVDLPERPERPPGEARQLATRLASGLRTGRGAKLGTHCKRALGAHALGALSVEAPPEAQAMSRVSESLRFFLGAGGHFQMLGISGNPDFSDIRKRGGLGLSHRVVSARLADKTCFRRKPRKEYAIAQRVRSRAPITQDRFSPQSEQASVIA